VSVAFQGSSEGKEKRVRVGSNKRTEREVIVDERTNSPSATMIPSFPLMIIERNSEVM